MAASDRVILARDVLNATIRVRRIGVETLLSQFGQEEPDLAEIVRREIKAIHSKLLDSGIPTEEATCMMHRTESVILVCLVAIRAAYQRLRDEAAETLVEKLGDKSMGESES
jgi:hypothetical protein